MHGGTVRGTAAVGAAVIVIATLGGCTGHTRKGRHYRSSRTHTHTHTTADSGWSSTTPASASPTPTPVPVPVLAGRPVLSTAQLKALAFKEGATPGTRRMPVNDLKLGPSTGAPDSPPPSPAACANVMAVLDGAPALAGVSQQIAWTSNAHPGRTVLASYPLGGAAQVFRTLVADLAQCSSMAGRNAAGSFSATVLSEGAPPLRDEALRLEVVSAQAGRNGTTYEDCVFVRVGDATASFRTTDVDRRTPFPAALMAQQVRRLAQAQQSPSGR